MSDDIRGEYIEKAKSLGVVNGALKQEMLLALFKKNGICVYPLDKVEAYLDKMFGDAKGIYDSATWCWYPLREEDEGDLRSTHRRNNGQIRPGVYQQAVPLPVLLTVEKIVSAVPGVHFYVSDQVRPSNRDPFLAVTATGMEMLVIERWDEPSFRP